MIKVSPRAPTQRGLDLLAKTPEFQTIFQQEMKARGLQIPWAMECFHMIDYTVTWPTFFNGGPITVKDVDFDPFDRAILITLLKVQDNWSHPLGWSEETSCKEGR